MGSAIETKVRMLSWILVVSVAIHATSGRFIVKNDDGEAALEVVYQAQATQVYTDDGTLIWDYLGIWEPNSYENFFLLAMRAEPHHDAMTGSIQMAQGVSDEMQRKYMKHPYDFTEVWRDQGGFGRLDVAFWRPVCDPGFQPLGDIAFACDWCGWPKPGSYLTRVMCVSEELLEPCTFRTTPLWTNDGGWEEERGSVWEIDGSISRFWYANKGWDSLPNTGRAFCLKEPEFIPDTE